MYEYFRNYYEEHKESNKLKIFNDFYNIVVQKDTSMFFVDSGNVYKLLFEYDFVKLGNFTEENFPLALKYCLKKIFDKYVVNEVYYADVTQTTDTSSIYPVGKSDEELIILYIQRNLLYQLKNWSKTYSTSKYQICKECGALFLKDKNPKNTSQLYCKDCKFIINKEKTRLRVKKYRSKCNDSKTQNSKLNSREIP